MSRNLQSDITSTTLQQLNSALSVLVAPSGERLQGDGRYGVFAV